MSSEQIPDHYQTLTRELGLIDVSNRTRMELTGKDRTSFLNGFCTNDLRRLEPGQGCETFLTNVKGRSMGHGFIFCRPESLVLETVPGQADTLLAHLDRYLIREDVQISDRTRNWSELLVAGPQAGVSVSGWLHAASSQPLSDQMWVFVHQLPWQGEDAHLVFMPCADLRRRIAELQPLGAVLCGDPMWEVLRIEAGWPQFGQDITPANLPQEVARDATAISFTKGCYLGQETVARLDARGHVNRLLVTVRWQSSTVPVAGEPLEADGQPVGEVTSAVWSPRWNAPLGFAYVRTPHHQAGTALRSAAGPAIVIDRNTYPY